MQAFYPMVLVLIAEVAGTDVSIAASEPTCPKDYPVATVAVDYRQEFAEGSLLPSEILLNGHVLKFGVTPGALSSLLGEPTAGWAAPQTRSAQEQCQYLVELLKGRPTSMYLYKLAALEAKNMAGTFRASEWTLPDIGTIRAFWYTPQQGGRELSYLYDFSPTAIAPSKVERVKGKYNSLLRPGPPRMEWSLETNRLSIDTHGVDVTGGKALP